MEYKYDPGTDILVLQLRDGNPDFGEQSGPIITHYNKDGKPIEIEILDASDTALDMLKPILKGRKKLTA